MAEIELFNILRDSSVGVFSNIWMVAGILAIIIFCFFLFVTQARLKIAAIMSIIPFVIASMTQLLDIGWGMGIIIIILAFILAAAMARLLSR